MSLDKLQICREFLERAYREKLGIDFANSIVEIGNTRKPFWRTVSDNDLTSESNPSTTGAAGLLLDPELGLLSYILPFHPEMNLHKQIVRALALRSQLSTERNYVSSATSNSDSRGSWRVVMHWLVENRDRSLWIKQIMAVRNETAFSEEISFDAIALSEGSFKTQVEEYGFPRLLLTTREVLRKQHLEDMTVWLSANKLVEQALVNFTAQFHKSEERKLANDIIRAMQSFHPGLSTSTESIQAPETPQTIRSIRVRAFRNLRDVQFDFGVQPVGASIIHGPNGTGKSSLCEAISIALFKSSFRYKWFSDRGREKDVSATDRAREYLLKYLTPVNDSQAEPNIALDEQTFSRPELVSTDKTEEADLAMCGTILTQDASLEFVRMSAHELGARVLRGYSELADHIEEFTDGKVFQADTERKNFLRGLGISAAITKPDTAYEQIAGREIDKSLPPFPNSLVTWLELAGNFMGNAGEGLPQRWRAWGNDANRNELASSIASSNKGKDKLVRDVREWLFRFNELVLGSTELLKIAEAKVGSMRHDLENIFSRIITWGEWLEAQTQAPANISSPEILDSETKLKGMQIQQNQLLESGRKAGDHFDHLAQVEAYVREIWSKQNPDDCPTCGSNHSERGGILKVVESLRAKTAAERDKFREDYRVQQMEIDQVQKRLTELGQAQCPLSTDEQTNMSESFQWLIPGSVSLSEWISVKAQRDALLNSITTLRQMPSVPTSISAESEAERIVERILSQFQEADKIFEAPTNWKPVKDKLSKTLAEIVNKHLPNTLTRLWSELALNLTSAPWLLPQRPQLDVVTKRGEQASTIRIKDRLARYILNQSEIHILGLAWFFTRYLTRGRFFHACIVMDDPAHELDQTSFRDLCRLLETIIRLHRVYDRPLKLIIMLNQETRAIEAARATSAILTMLGWTRDQENTLNAINVIGEGFHAPQPTILFEKTAS